MQRALMLQEEQIRCPSQQLEVQRDLATGSGTGLDVAQRTSVVRFPNFLSDEEIRSIHSLSLDVGDSGRSVCASTHRTGAWDTCYLSTGGAFRLQLPTLLDRLLSAAREADASQGWGLLPASNSRLVPRVVEYHTVTKHGSLPWAHHFDAGSLITVDCMLSSPGDFEGGTFQTLECDGALHPHVFERGDVQIFRSHKKHCVAPVSAGTRRVLVIELWDGAERCCAHRCERRDGPCPLEQHQQQGRLQDRQRSHVDGA